MPTSWESGKVPRGVAAEPRALCPSLCSHSEPTQCTMLYSRQGTTETIEEVEAEQEEEVLGVVPQPGDAEDEEDEEEEEEEEGEEEEEEEDDDDEEEEDEEEREEEMEFAVGVEDASLTPEEELPQFCVEDGDVEAPPSYSKAVSFEHLSFGSQDDDGAKNHMVVSPDDSRTDKLESSILPALTHELTASELLLNK